MSFRCRSIVGIVLCSSLFVATAESAMVFSDTAATPHRHAIEYLQAKNIIGGYPDGSFRPDNAINRAELVKILIGSFGLSPAVKDFHDCFPDVTDQWFAPYVCLAKTKGWISGYPDGTFKPEKVLKTVEAIKIIAIASRYPLASMGESPYRDVVPGAWYEPYVLSAFGAGILPTDRQFLGVDDDATRGSAAEILYRSVSRDDPAEARSSSSVGAFNSSVVAPPRRRNGDENISSSSSATSSTAASKRNPTISFLDVTKKYGDPDFTLRPYSDSAGLYTFTSSNPTVATVNGDTVTIKAVGTTTLTVSQAAYGYFGIGTASAKLTVSAIQPSLGVFTPLTRTTADPLTFTLNPPLSNSPGSFAYKVSNPLVATVNGATVTVKGVGQTTITATQAASGNFLSNTVETTLTILGYCDANVNPCANGGTCKSVSSGGANIMDAYQCLCPSGFDGPTCADAY